LISDQITPVHLSGRASFEQALQRRNAAKTAILQADTDQRLRRALLRSYAGDNIRLAVGQTCFSCRDAQRTDLVKMCWKGPAKVLMVENNEAGNVSTYWICYKTQLIRCAPHHCRPDFNAMAVNTIDNLQEAKDVLRQMKSRGVTRYLDLNRVNEQLIVDVEEDEEMMSHGSNVEQEAKRRPLDLSLAPSVSYESSIADDDEVPVPPEPHAPGLRGVLADPIAANETGAPHEVPVPEPSDNFHIDQFLDEPSAEQFPPTPINGYIHYANNFNSNSSQRNQFQAEIANHQEVQVEDICNDGRSSSVLGRTYGPSCCRCCW